MSSRTVRVSAIAFRRSAHSCRSGKMASPEVLARWHHSAQQAFAVSAHARLSPAHPGAQYSIPVQQSGVRQLRESRRFSAVKLREWHHLYPADRSYALHAPPSLSWEQSLRRMPHGLLTEACVCHFLPDRWADKAFAAASADRAYQLWSS